MLNCWRSSGSKRLDMRDGGRESHQPTKPSTSNLKSGLTKGELIRRHMGNCEFWRATTSVGPQLYL